jgi:hypothetical protein
MTGSGCITRSSRKPRMPQVSLDKSFAARASACSAAEADLAASAAALPAIAVIDTAKSTDHLMTFLGRSSLRA